jgi:hypothetical protein
MNKTAKKIMIWVTFAGLVLFAIYAWLPEWITAVGAAVGFFSILIVEKMISKEYLIKIAYTFGILILATIFSYGLLLFACRYLPGINQGGERAKTSLLLSNLFFVGAPILAISLFVWLPRYLRGIFRK